MSIADTLKGHGLLRSIAGLDNSRVGDDGLTEREREARLAAIRVKRLEIARSVSHWTEVDEADLVERRPYLVSATSDQLYTPHRGIVFAYGSVDLVEQTARLAFFVREGELVFLEPVGQTYSELLERRAARRRRGDARSRGQRS